MREPIQVDCQEDGTIVVTVHRVRTPRKWFIGTAGVGTMYHYPTDFPREHQNGEADMTITGKPGGIFFIRDVTYPRKNVSSPAHRCFRAEITTDGYRIVEHNDHRYPFCCVCDV